MNKPKRVWNKKSPVFYKGKCVWKLGDKLGIYDPNFTEVDEGQIYPNNRWENVGSGEELQIYDSNKPTNIGTFKDGIVASYEFQDYDGTVLKSGSVKDGETPVPPTDPTRQGYTFTGWSPEVGPISEDTTYVATYESVGYTITISSIMAVGDGYQEIEGVATFNKNSVLIPGIGYCVNGNSCYAQDEWLYFIDKSTEEVIDTVTFELEEGWTYGNGWSYYDEENQEWITCDEEDITGDMKIALHVQPPYNCFDIRTYNEETQEEWSGGVLDKYIVYGLPEGSSVCRSDSYSFLNYLDVYNSQGESIDRITATPDEGKVVKEWQYTGDGVRWSPIDTADGTPISSISVVRVVFKNEEPL